MPVASSTDLRVRLRRDLSAVASLGALIKVPGLSLMPAAVALGLFAWPVAWSRLWNLDRTWRAIAGLAIACIPAGLALRLDALGAGATGAGGFDLVSVLLWVTSFATLPGLMLYLAERCGFRRTLVLATTGAMVGVVIGAEGPVQWKGDLGIFATVLALALVAGRGRFWPTSVLIGSGILSAASDARSMAAFSIAALVALWMPTRFGERIGRRPGRAVALALIGGAIVMYGVYRALLAGRFGVEAQIRTELQAIKPGPFIFSGRVEWYAAFEAAQARPLGWGTSVIATDEVRSDAVSAVGAAGGDYSSPYFSQTVLGQRSDFHSILLDLWYHFGLVGVALWVVVAVVLLASIPKVLGALGSHGAVGIYLLAIASWDMLFSPMPSIDRVALALFYCIALSAGLRWSPKEPLPTTVALRSRSRS